MVKCSIQTLMAMVPIFYTEEEVTTRTGHSKLERKIISPSEYFAKIEPIERNDGPDEIQKNEGKTYSTCSLLEYWKLPLAYNKAIDFVVDTFDRMLNTPSFFDWATTTKYKSMDGSQGTGVHKPLFFTEFVELSDKRKLQEQVSHPMARHREMNCYL